MAIDLLDEEKLTWRRMAIIGAIFLSAIILAGVALIVFRGLF